MGPQLSEQLFAAAFLSSWTMWHFLYFFPLPHQQGSFLPGFCAGSFGSVLLIDEAMRSNSPTESSCNSNSLSLCCLYLSPLFFWATRRSAVLSMFGDVQVAKGMCKKNK